MSVNSAGAAVVAATVMVAMPTAAAVHVAAATAHVVAAAAEHQQKQNDQPDAGTVVVETHVCHLTCSSLSYDMPNPPPVYLVRR